MRIQLLGVAIAVLVVAGCRTSHQVDMTHEIKPIHITLDINLKVDQELDNFFGDIDQAAASDMASEN